MVTKYDRIRKIKHYVTPKVKSGKYTQYMVFSQEELDAVPMDYEGEIQICFGTKDNPAIIKNRRNCKEIWINGIDDPIYAKCYNCVNVNIEDYCELHDNSEGWSCQYANEISAYDNSVILNAGIEAVVKLYDNATLKHSMWCDVHIFSPNVKLTNYHPESNRYICYDDNGNISSSMLVKKENIHTN